MTVVARLKPAEPELQRGAPDGQLASIDLAAYAAELGYPLLTGAYGQLASESPSVAEMPFPFPKPSTEEGTHLSYSLQWFAFGVLMFIGFGYAARQQARNAAIDAEDAEAQAASGRLVGGSCTPADRWPAAVLSPASGRTRPRRKRKTPSWTPRGSEAVDVVVPEPVARVKRALAVLGAEDTVTVFDSKVPTAAAAAATLGCDVAAITNSLVFDLEGAPLLILASGGARVDVLKVGALLGTAESAEPPPVRAGAHRQEVAAWPRWGIRKRSGPCWTSP